MAKVNRMRLRLQAPCAGRVGGWSRGRGQGGARWRLRPRYRPRSKPSDREVIIELNRRGEKPRGGEDVEREEVERVRKEAEETRRESRERLDAFLSENLITIRPAGQESEGTAEESATTSTGLGAGEEDLSGFISEVRTKLDDFETLMKKRVTGREREIRLLLLSLFSQQHVLLLGPSGIGKSLLSDCVLEILDRGGDDAEQVYTFRRQLNRFTTPEELFGPLSVKGLQKDAHVRLTEAYLPGATLAFLDEAFKASSSILNSLLTILNERTFCEDGSCELPDKVPLLMCIFSSNEIPPANDTSVHALFDRILIRLPMKPLQGEELVTMLQMMHNSSSGSPSSGQTGGEESLAFLKRSDILRIKEYSQQHVSVPESVVDLLKKLRVFLRDALDVSLSDRRLVQIVQVLRVCACLNGRRFVNKIDCLLLQHMVWDHDVKNIPRVRKFIENQLLEGCSSMGEWNKRRDKIFRDAIQRFNGDVYMKGDSMSARYTAYRRGKMKRGAGNANLSPGARTVEERIKGLAREMEELVNLQNEFRDPACTHQFLLGELGEIQPKLMKSAKAVRTLLEELYLLEECLQRGSSPEVMVELFPSTLAMFSKTWKTAL
ncbi:P-loop-containing nucleoside triphosphate hydrolase [Chloropicon primus]|uniref:P-loop-containing nucleoside triphosphate hydrolase n=2 Tax=Chloropicon primus TaxID=1764295 RepID=A0A5B8N1Q6_9CHLO|nr:P-loop-containing nucleoside triphosphate hydrolase [Chloropicon primus]UPR05010.1 P-loop-containing nucleoside triphosphate hydrolase [Chloropicon primus]|eukprot:QDZ25815.1 P-loop-containing nucleoside triphosphate hydrolase [Chloropicon primus]